MVVANTVDWYDVDVGVAVTYCCCGVDHVPVVAEHTVVIHCYCRYYCNAGVVAVRMARVVAVVVGTVVESVTSSHWMLNILFAVVGSFKQGTPSAVFPSLQVADVAADERVVITFNRSLYNRIESMEERCRSVRPYRSTILRSKGRHDIYVSVHGTTVSVLYVGGWQLGARCGWGVREFEWQDHCTV